MSNKEHIYTIEAFALACGIDTSMVRLTTRSGARLEPQLKDHLETKPETSVQEQDLISEVIEY